MISFHKARLRHVCILLASALILFDCDDSVDNSYIWGPMVKVRKGDQRAELVLIDPRPLSLYVPPGPSNPEYFEVWMSTDGVNFSLFKKVDDIATTSVEITDLTNGQSYYFYVSSHRGTESMKSGTVMTIPSISPKSEVYLPGADLSLQRLSPSYDQKYITYTSSSNLFLKPTTSGSPVSLGYDYYGTNWSTTENSMVYFDSKQEGLTVYPNQLILLKPESNKSDTLLHVEYHDYSAMYPSFRPNDVTVAFLSNEGNTQKYIYDVWTIHPSTLEKERLSNFEATGFYAGDGYDWSMAGDEIYLTGRLDVNSADNIYKMSLSTKALVPVIQSAWGERRPSLSPDNTMLAFVSGRSGADELWTYDFATGKYAQITDETTGHFDARYTNLDWLNNDQMLITVYKAEGNRAVKIDVR